MEILRYLGPTLPPMVGILLGAIGLWITYLKFRHQQRHESGKNKEERERRVEESTQNLLSTYKQDLDSLKEESTTLREKSRAINQSLDNTIFRLNEIKMKLEIIIENSEVRDNWYLVEKEKIREHIRYIDELIESLWEIRPSL